MADPIGDFFHKYQHLDAHFSESGDLDRNMWLAVKSEMARRREIPGAAVVVKPCELGKRGKAHGVVVDRSEYEESIAKIGKAGGFGAHLAGKCWCGIEHSTAERITQAEPCEPGGDATEAGSSCWHCGVVLEVKSRVISALRCEDCPDECDVENCDQPGCGGAATEHQVDAEHCELMDESGPAMGSGWPGPDHDASGAREWQRLSLGGGVVLERLSYGWFRLLDEQEDCAASIVLTAEVMSALVEAVIGPYAKIGRTYTRPTFPVSEDE